MSRLKKYISLLYAVFRGLIPPRKVSGSKKILFIAMGHIGDTIIDASAWQTIAKQAISQGKEIILLTTKENWSIFKRILETNQWTCIECDKRLSSVDSYKRSLSALKRMGFDTIIARPHGNRWVYLLAATLHATKRYIIIEKEIMISLGDSILQRMFLRRYTNVIIEDEKSCEKEVLEKLLYELGIIDYHMSILPIPKSKMKCVMPHEYITIAVDSQNTARRWPTDRFIALIRELLKTYDDDIILTGSFLNEEDTKRYEEAFYENGRVKNMIGKCGFDQWIELLRGARFHIGVDSGSIHVAASVGTLAFCLTGVWHGHRFFPYNMEKDQQGTAVPICIYWKNADIIPCFGCAAKRRYGWGNDDCYNRCKNLQPNMCLEHIGVDDIMMEIEKAKLMIK